MINMEFVGVDLPHPHILSILFYFDVSTPGFILSFSPDPSVTIAAVHVVAAVTATMGAKDVTREAQWARAARGLIAKSAASKPLNPTCGIIMDYHMH